MFSFAKWFKKDHEEDYENALAAIAQDIQKRQTKLSDIRRREGRSTLLATFYTLALWVAYVSIWYLGMIPSLVGHQRRRNELGKALAAAPVVIGPVIILFIRQIVQRWYARIGNAEEKTLKTLLKQQRAKVEEIKKKTNYYSTRNLIERYDDPSGSPLHRQMSPGRGRAPPAPSTPQRVPLHSNAIPGTPNDPKSNLSPPGRLVTQPAPPPSRQWYDKLLDALLGDSEHDGNVPTSQYALICEKCFTHNGLVKENMWEDAQYICPKCGHFNPSVRTKRTLPSPLSPLSAPASLPSNVHQPTPVESPDSARRSTTPDRQQPEVNASLTMEVDS